MIDLSISIVNTSNWAYVEPALHSIYTNTKRVRFEILVVDNVSDDGSVEKLRAQFPEVVLTENRTRLGFAANNNINLRKARGRYLMLLNDDVLVQPGAIDRAVEYLEAHPEVGMVACHMVSPDGTTQRTSGRRLDTLWTSFWGETPLAYRFPTYPFFGTSCIRPGQAFLQDVDLGQESGLVLRRELLERVGYLDERFFMFGEGVDWSRRIKTSGFRVVFLPSARILHFGGTTNRKIKDRMHLQHYKSVYRYFVKESRWAGLGYRAIVVGANATKFAAFTTKIALRPKNAESTRESARLSRLVCAFMLRHLHDPAYPYPTTITA